MAEPYYSDEFVTLYHGDAVDLLPELAPRCVDAVLTDPPYSSGGRRENARSLRKSMTRSVSDEEWIAGDSMSTTGFVWLMRAVASRAKPLLRPGAHFLSFIDWRMHGNLCGALESADYRQHPTLVWDKQHFGMGAIFRNQHEWIVHFSYGPPAEPARRDVGNVLRCPPVRDGIHPTEKPPGLLAQIVTTVCPEGGLGAGHVLRVRVGTARGEALRPPLHRHRRRRAVVRGHREEARADGGDPHRATTGAGATSLRDRITP